MLAPTRNQLDVTTRHDEIVHFDKQTKTCTYSNLSRYKSQVKSTREYKSIDIMVLLSWFNQGISHQASRLPAKYLWPPFGLQHPSARRKPSVRPFEPNSQLPSQKVLANVSHIGLHTPSSRHHCNSAYTRGQSTWRSRIPKPEQLVLWAVYRYKNTCVVSLLYRSGGIPIRFRVTRCSWSHRWNPVIQSIWANSCTLSKKHNIIMSISWAYEWHIMKPYQTPITGWMPVPFCGRCHVRFHMGWWYYNPILEKSPCPAGFSEKHGINLIQQKMWKTNGLSTNSVYIYTCFPHRTVRLQEVI